MERSLCAFEGDVMVGTSDVLPLELTLPGQAQLPAGGLTWVAVLPTHRRRGILRQLVAAQFAEMGRHAEPVSVLLASEGNIYGRFGYGPATSAISFSVERAQVAFARPVSSEGRTVLLTDREAAAELPMIYERLRRHRVGSVSRSAGWWVDYLHDPEHHREGGGEMFHAKHETVPGEADGYVTYRIKEEWSGWNSRNTLLVVELLAADPKVYAVLWDYILNTDLVHTVSFSRGRMDEPLR
ncbi:MAG: GNAT family N-acetyltransferase [bacterium]